MIKPLNGDKLPKLPEPEATTLKAHLKQVSDYCTSINSHRFFKAVCLKVVVCYIPQLFTMIVVHVLHQGYLFSSVVFKNFTALT